MFEWMRKIVGLNSSDPVQADQQLEVIAEREPSIEERLDRLIRRLGSYNKHTETDLKEIMDELDSVLAVVEKIIATLENIGGADRAKALRRRLKNNRTRAQNAFTKLPVSK